MTTTTRDDEALSEAVSLETKAYGMAHDIITDSAQAFVALDPRQAVDQIALKSLFFTEDWVYIVCDRIASMISSQWLRVMRDVVAEGKKIPEPAENHPLQRLLEHPNDDQDYHSWMYGLVVDEVLMGNAIVWRAASAGQLITLPSELTTIDMAADGSVKAYRVSYSQELGAKALSFAPEEICHIRRPNPSSRIYGLSPFLPASKAVSFNRYTSEYLNNFYQKGAQPGIVLEMVDVANEKNALRLLRSFENAYTGRANQRKTAVLPKGVRATQVSHTLADQQLIDYIHANRETILNILQIPKHEVGLDGGRSLGGGDEYRSTRANFWRGPLKAIMRRIAGSLTRFFASELGEGHYFEFDLTDIDALQEDDAQKADLAQKLLSTHTLNEVRAKLYALEPVPNGDTVHGAGEPSLLPGLPPASLSVTDAMGVLHDVEKGLIKRDAAAAMLANIYGFSPEAIAAMLPPPQDPTAPLEKNLKNVEIFKKSAQSWFEQTDAALEAGAKQAAPKLTKRLLTLFAAQADAVAGVLGAYKSLDGYEKKELPPKQKLKKAIRLALDDLEQQYLDGYAPDLEAQAELGYDSTLFVSFNETDKRKLEAIRERNANRRRTILEDRGLKTFAWINETTTERMMQVIEDGIASKLSIEDITKNLVSQFSDIDNIVKRAEVIARTEVLTASSIGQAAALKDAERVLGKMKKMWINAGDERVRQGPKYDHVRLQGEVRDSNKKFSNGLMFPRDPTGEAGDVIQCRCRMVAASAEDADAMGFGELDTEETSGGET